MSSLSLFPVPQDIETEVFARLPDAFRMPGRPSDWLIGQLRGQDLACLLEGPTFDRAGNLFVVDVAHGRIFRIDREGAFHLLCKYDGEPNGLALHRDGRMFVADHKNGIMVLDTETGHIVPFFDRPRLERFKGVNDLTFSMSGDLYFTDQGQTGLQDPTGRVYRLSPDGTLECLLSNVPSPNGLVLAPDETSLYVAATRANGIWRAPFMLDGTPSKVGLFIQLSGLGGPDGMAMDQAGGLAIAHIDLGTVWIFDRRGEPKYRVRSCDGMKTTNIAYDPSDPTMLYITEAEAGVVLRARVPTPGAALFSHG
ncbi:SMP-30/gluconolactonase/LRE family protein [Aurantimonas coralicida]|uniref:SMP-30/gluconolactonase/LRE family protein n=1 Tax=Aurantimonas coralicida TaxID=182270 RepID=UPI001D17E73E|nr:SMP-30/gluconolactonase/LRE family protein [Aurantimonas coralicida]MCC4300191.1 SMP-30/gluconolactonase/LRE family protein [Aurantimonas coralicida]